MKHNETREYADWLVECIVGTGLVEKWWESRNKSFDMQTPNQMWIDDKKRVLYYLNGHVLGGGYL